MGDKSLICNMIRCFTSWKWGITNPLKTCDGVETINRFTSVIHIMVSKKIYKNNKLQEPTGCHIFMNETSNDTLRYTLSGKIKIKAN